MQIFQLLIKLLITGKIIIKLISHYQSLSVKTAIIIVFKCRIFVNKHNILQEFITTWAHLFYFAFLENMKYLSLFNINIYLKGRMRKNSFHWNTCCRRQQKISAAFSNREKNFCQRMNKI